VVVKSECPDVIVTVVITVVGTSTKTVTAPSGPVVVVENELRPEVKVTVVVEGVVGISSITITASPV